MPNCFQLFAKGSAEAESLNGVDERICIDILHVEVHPKQYGGGYVENGYNWFDFIGWDIAVNGYDLQSQELLDIYQGKLEKAKQEYIDKMDDATLYGVQYHTNGLKVLGYLRDHYMSSAFYATKDQLARKEKDE